MVWQMSFSHWEKTNQRHDLFIDLGSSTTVFVDLRFACSICFTIHITVSLKWRKSFKYVIEFFYLSCKQAVLNSQVFCQWMLRMNST